MKKNIHLLFLFGVIIAVGIGVYFVFKPFIVAILLAFIIWQLFKKLYEKINQAMKGKKSLASITTCLIIFVILVIPFAFMLGLITNEVNQLYKSFQENNWSLNLGTNSNLAIFESLGLDSSSLNLQSILSSEHLESFKGVSTFLLNALKKTYQGASSFIFTAFTTFFILYYFFKDGDRMLKRVMHLSPLPDEQEKMLVDNFINISKATLKGTLIIALVQGGILGLTFWAVGLSSPAIWGLVTALFSIIPLLGSGLIWGPGAVILFFAGQWWQGFILLFVGIFIVSMVDNLLRPKLVENQSSLHPLLVFLSTIGGIAVFGMLGFLIGPVILVLFLSLLKIYESDFKIELKKMNK